eukprot:PhF_6_TR31149/c0_g1_i1/m.45631
MSLSAIELSSRLTSYNAAQKSPSVHPSIESETSLSLFRPLKPLSTSVDCSSPQQQTFTPNKSETPVNIWGTAWFTASSSEDRLSAYTPDRTSGGFRHTPGSRRSPSPVQKDMVHVQIVTATPPPPPPSTTSTTSRVVTNSSIPSATTPPLCDKCHRVVPGGDFRTHNRLCIGKLCNRCRAPVTGSYEDHKALCTARKCDRCGTIPAGSFTEHNKMCRAAAAVGTTTGLLSQDLISTLQSEDRGSPCGLCGGWMDGDHDAACGRVCPKCKCAYHGSWEDHIPECELRLE